MFSTLKVSKLLISNNFLLISILFLYLSRKESGRKWSVNSVKQKICYTLIKIDMLMVSFDKCPSLLQAK